MKHLSLSAVLLLHLALQTLACSSNGTATTPDRTDDPSISDHGSELDLTPPREREHTWYDDAVVYQVFVRSFADSSGDGIGDIQGLISRLDYINDGRPGEGDDLEATAIWLLPIFESPSYHGYDTTDYLAIAQDYGSQEDFAELLAACEERGIRLIVDLVLNHTSSSHPWFIDSRSGPQADYRSWYVWRDNNPGWTQPWSSHPVWHLVGDQYYYGLFWHGMPDLNYRNPQVVEAMTAVATHWLELGLHGYRIDAARYLFEAENNNEGEQPETHQFFAELRAVLEQIDPEVYLVAEAWTNRDNVATYYGDGDQFHQAFDFELANIIVEDLRRDQVTRIRNELLMQQRSQVPWHFEAVFLNNHDLQRLSHRLRQPHRERAAATILLTLPGTPYIYYGDELGMGMGRGGGDEAKRTPMPWDDSDLAGFSTVEPWYPLAAGHEEINVATQLAEESSLLNHYRALIRLRHAHPALRAAGQLQVIEMEDDAAYVVLRTHESEALLVIVNGSDSVLELPPLDLSAHQASITRNDSQDTVLCLYWACPHDSWSAPLEAVTVPDALQPGEAWILQL